MAIKKIKRGDRNEWLQLRRQYIGGADAGTVCGMNEYQSPYSLWCEKKGVVAPVEENERMRVGTYMEDYVAKRFEEETGKKVQKSNFSYFNSDYPWGIGDVDRLVCGEDAILECKTTSELNLKHYRNGDYPDRFFWQVQHYMAILNKKKAYLAVLIGNRDFKVFEIPRNDAEIEALMLFEKEFYEHLQSGNPPPIDGSDSTREALQAQQSEPPEEEPEPADLSDKKQVLDTLMEINAAIEQLESQRDAIKNQLIESIGDSWHGNCSGYSISYKPQTRKTFDWKKLQKERPEIPLDGYFKSSTSRTLKIAKGEQLE